MKLSIINRVQNSVTRIIVPFLIYTFNNLHSDEIIKYYATAMALSGILIFGFPLKLNKSLGDLKKYIVDNQIFIIYIFFISIIVFVPTSLIWKFSPLTFLLAGLYFACGHIHVSFEKYCQFYNKELNAFVLFSIYNSVLLTITYFTSRVAINVNDFFIIYLLLSIVMTISLFLNFFKITKITVSQIKAFFNNTVELGKYSLVQNLISRGDSLVLPLFFQSSAFAKYYMLTRFIDIGNFTISMFSQVSLIQSYKYNKAPNLFPYIIIGILASTVSLMSFFSYNYYLSNEINLYLTILFTVIITKSILLYFQDFYIFNSTERKINLATYIQILVVAILFLFVNYSITIFNVYFYIPYIIIAQIVSILYLSIYKRNKNAPIEI